MRPEEFQRVIELGLGRAIPYLQQHDSTPHGEIILHTSLRNTTYDRQTEWGKATYLLDIIALTGESEFYYDKIIEAATNITPDMDEYDAAHLLDMLESIHQRGLRDTRPYLTDIFLKMMEQKSDFGASAIVQVGGLNGFRFVADKLGQLIQRNSDFKVDGYLCFIIEDNLGEARSKEFFASIRQENANIDAYLRAVEKGDETRHTRNTASREIEKMSYSELKAQGVLDQKQTTALIGWHRHASKADLQKAARDLLAEEDINRIKNYLFMFRSIPVPIDPEPLIKLTNHSDDRVQWGAYRILENTNSDSIREFALKQIQQGEIVGWAVRLLNNNFVATDWQLIEPLTQQKLDKHNHHMLQIGIQNLFDAYPSTEAVQSLLNLYEYAPCSFCREQIVEQLHSIDALPSHIQAECVYDSNIDLRVLVQNDFVRGK